MYLASGFCTVHLCYCRPVLFPSIGFYYWILIFDNVSEEEAYGMESSFSVVKTGKNMIKFGPKNRSSFIHYYKRHKGTRNTVGQAVAICWRRRCFKPIVVVA